MTVGHFKPLDRRFAINGRLLFWTAFLGAVLLAWSALFLMVAAFAEAAPLGRLGPGMGALSMLLSGGWPMAGGLDWAALCLQGPSAIAAAPLDLATMWAIMVLAMMLPTAVPMLAAYDGIVGGGGASARANLWALAGGYAVVWIGFSLSAAALQWALALTGELGAGGMLESGQAAAALLALAGVYQFSHFKAACLSRCRAPMTFFLSRWRDGAGGAFSMGLRQGLDCLGCCWALMTLALVGGTMNLIWMGVAMALMTLEKLPHPGRLVTAPLGVALLAAAAGLLLYTGLTN